jgi:hypothetical protein
MRPRPFPFTDTFSAVALQLVALLGSPYIDLHNHLSARAVIPFRFGGEVDEMTYRHSNGLKFSENNIALCRSK